MRGLTVSTFEWISLAVLALCAWIFPRLGDRFFRHCENAFGRFARRKKVVIFLAAVTPILLRLALLPVLAIPARSISHEFSYLLAANTFAHVCLTNPPSTTSRSFGSSHCTIRVS